jgi:hypothetical protein
VVGAFDREKIDDGKFLFEFTSHLNRNDIIVSAVENRDAGVGVLPQHRPKILAIVVIFHENMRERATDDMRSLLPQSGKRRDQNDALD